MTRKAFADWFVRVISEYLKKKELKAWHLRYTHKESHEVYSINSQTEAIRCNTVADYSLLLHREKKNHNNKEENNGFMGESKADFQLFPRKWRGIVDDTISRADLIENPEYDLPEAWEPEMQENPVFDDSLAENIPEKLQEVNRTLSSLKEDSLLGCRLASFEVFLEKYNTKIENSHGLSLRMPSTKILWDFVLLSQNREVEINNFSKRRRFNDFDWQGTLIKEAKHLIDLQEARLPPTGKFPVVMADEALDTLFDYFLGQADGSALYHKYSSFEKGHSVYKNREEALEPLSIETNPSLPGGMRSGFFEELGYPLKPLVVIENGILKNFTISGKLSYLLKMPRTSSLSNASVHPGETPYEDFLGDGVFELLRFSTFHPNPITGAFSGEIRLGYWHKNGKKIPLRGGSVSGIIQEDFLKARLSRETEIRESYQGPRGVFFENLTLAGE